MISLSVLCQKDVINIVNGQNIGRVDDIEFCSEDAKVKCLVIFGRPRFFGLLGRGCDIKIAWENVVNLGQYVILATNCEEDKNAKHKGFAIKFD